MKRKTKIESISFGLFFQERYWCVRFGDDTYFRRTNMD